MQAFANGVNAYINSIEPNNLPLEYKLLGVKQVQPWTVLDEMTFAKYMAWDLIHSFDPYVFHNAHGKKMVCKKFTISFRSIVQLKRLSSRPGLQMKPR